MITQMVELVKFLGLFALILFLIAIIFAILDTALLNMKVNIAKRDAINKLKEQLDKVDGIAIFENTEKEDVDKE